MLYVIVSHDSGRTVTDGPEAAWGPFNSDTEAKEWHTLLIGTVSGYHHIVPLRTPIAQESER